jgi:putative chitinase
MKLSKYFTLEELTQSQYATRKGIDNTPSGQEMTNLVSTAVKMDEVRKLLGKPVYVSSGYRNAAVNLAVGGSATSSHTTGQAVDFTCPEFGTVEEVFNAIAKSALRYDQLINEGNRWIHLGFGRQLRHEKLKATFKNGLATYEVVK